MPLLWFRHITQLVQVCAAGEPHLSGDAQGRLAIVEDGALVVGADGRFLHVGSDAAVEAALSAEERAASVQLDGSGLSVVPGLVDGHTHPVWAGDRVHEFRMKLAGATYMEVHAAGGGIGFTVRHTRAASEDELLALFVERAARMLRQGTTLAEAKSGYGLDGATELKMLRVLHRARVEAATPLELSCTYLGAHSVPAEYKERFPGDHAAAAAAYTQSILDEQLPLLARAQAAGQIGVDNIDVFCERGVFECADTRRILEAGAAQLGAELNFHGDELTPIGAAELGGALQARAVSHLEHVSDAGIVAMAQRPTFAVLLPTTAYVLRLEPPPARKLIAGNVPVALGSDYNPNAHCMSLPFTMNLACVLMKMTLEEALVGATINAAASIGKSATHGSIEVGKWADFVVVAAPRWEHLVYQMADPPIRAVYKHGRAVFEGK